MIASQIFGQCLSWNQIASSFPGIHNPEEAIRVTAERCKKLGLIKCNDQQLTDGQIKTLRRKTVGKRKMKGVKV